MIANGWAVLCRATLAVACLLFFVLTAALCVRYAHIAILIALVGAWQGLLARRWGGWAHGTARLSGWADLLKHALLGDDGLILGTTYYLGKPSRWMGLGQLINAPLSQSVLAVRLFLASIWGPRWCASSVIRVKDYVHLATFASTGGGKGVSVVIPNLLSYRGSVVVTDPKSENFVKTAAHRRRKFGHRTIKLEPFGRDSDTFNVLDTIDSSAPDFIDQCRDMAAAMVVRTGKETELHFLESAEKVIEAFIAFVCASEPKPELRNLQTVRRLLSNRELYKACIKLMQESGDVAGGMLARLGDGLTSHEDRELASVLATVERVTGFLDSQPVAANTVSSSFDPRELRNGKTSIYLCLPPERLKSHAALQRLWVSSILRTLVRGADETHPVLFILDEIGNMGRLQIVEDAVTLMRGMGIRLWFIFQSLGQVKECFGDNAPTFLDNIGTQQYFTIRSYETAEALSKRIGDQTIASQSTQDGGSSSQPTGGGKEGGGSYSRSWSTTTNEIARKLLHPNEITTNPDDLALIFHNNLPVIPARLLKFFSAGEFRRGRAGRSRGLGLAGALTSVATLLLALALPMTATVLVEQIGTSLRRSAAARRTSYPVRAPLPYASPSYPGYRPPARRPARPRPTSGRGNAAGASFNDAWTVQDRQLRSPYR